MSFRQPQESRPEGEQSTTPPSQTYGSDTYASLVSLKAELQCDSIIGVKFVDSTPSNVTPIVKETRDYMKAKETRDGLQILFVPNVEALRTLLGQTSHPLADFDEALVDFSNPSDSHSKPSQVSNVSLMILIAMNFSVLLGLSVYNFWQFRIVTGLDTPSPTTQRAAKFGLPNKPSS